MDKWIFTYKSFISLQAEIRNLPIGLRRACKTVNRVLL